MDYVYGFIGIYIFNIFIYLIFFRTQVNQFSKYEKGIREILGNTKIGKFKHERHAEYAEEFGKLDGDESWIYGTWYGCTLSLSFLCVSSLFIVFLFWMLWQSGFKFDKEFWEWGYLNPSYGENLELIIFAAPLILAILRLKYTYWNKNKLVKNYYHALQTY